MDSNNALKEKIKMACSLRIDSINYIDTDIASTLYEYNKKVNPVQIQNVIFNDPATIVFWYDGTKTVVKAQGDDIFDPEKGLAMAITKKFMGNKGNYYNELKKWLPKKTEEPLTIDELSKKMNKLSETIKKVIGTGE